MIGERSPRIFVAGHRGMVGSAIVRCLRRERPDATIITADRSQLDLRNQAETNDFFFTQKFDYVYLAAAKVGGILANSTKPADFIYDNLTIETNVIHASHTSDVKRLLFLGSSCIYPKFAPQPIPEEALLAGPLEPTNDAYAIAKISGILLCKSYVQQHRSDFRALMPTNLYGPNDNFDPLTSHVIPGLIQKLSHGKVTGATEINLWGTGTPMREFLHVDDLANACVFVMNLDRATYDSRSSSQFRHLNVGSGTEVSIRDLALKLKEIIGFKGDLCWDTTKPDGTPRKLLNSNRLKSLGWQPSVKLFEGLRSTVDWYNESVFNEARNSVDH